MFQTLDDVFLFSSVDRGMPSWIVSHTQNPQNRPEYSWSTWKNNTTHPHLALICKSLRGNKTTPLIPSLYHFIKLYFLFLHSLGVFALHFTQVYSHYHSSRIIFVTMKTCLVLHFSHFQSNRNLFCSFVTLVFVTQFLHCLDASFFQ